MEILFEDKYILIANKEPGQPSQPDQSGVESLSDQVKAHTKNDVYILTRLDRPVKGLVLFAKDKNTADKLTKMVQEHSITKIYHALVCGNVEDEGHIESYLMKNSRLNISKIVNKGTVGSKIAILDYKLIEKRKDVNKVEINLKTGRHHQIRLQLSNINHPIYGDQRYGFQDKKQIMLYAYKLEFIHPVTKEVMTFKNLPNWDIVKNEEDIL